MSVTLHCDAPDCAAVAPAVARLGSVTCPPGWWMQVVGPRIIIACCDKHVSHAAANRGEASGGA